MQTFVDFMWKRDRGFSLPDKVDTIYICVYNDEIFFVKM